MDRSNRSQYQPRHGESRGPARVFNGRHHFSFVVSNASATTGGSRNSTNRISRTSLTGTEQSRLRGLNHMSELCFWQHTRKQRSAWSESIAGLVTGDHHDDNEQGENNAVRDTKNVTSINMELFEMTELADVCERRGIVREASVTEGRGTSRKERESPSNPLAAEGN